MSPMGSLYPVCVKTPKGIEEVERKAHGLALRSRQVLIMVDGKRDLEALQGIFPPAVVPGILDDLLSGGFIRALDPPKPAPPPPAVQPAASVPSAANDEERYALARNFMINTISAFLGVSGSSLVNKIEREMDIEGLAALYYDWRSALSLTGDGKKRLPELEVQLRKLLGEIPPPASVAAAPAPLAKVSSPKSDGPPRPSNDEERLDMARNFMLNTTNTFVGMAGSVLSDKVERSVSITELRHLYYDWRESMQLSREGKQRLPELEKKLAALLS